MRTDGLQVAVRPRSIFECLDLAVMFCGRRPLAVALATAVGALPCILLNRLLFAGADDDAILAAAVTLGIETVWASVPLTLYLGQSLFSDRFSWKDAAQACLVALPAMIAFQGMLRAACLVIWILAPVAYLGMYYLCQIILLERPALSRVWRRRRAVNREQGWRILALMMLDGLMLSIGTVLGTAFLDSVAQLWQGRSIAWGWDNGTGDIIGPLFSWHGQIAFWGACGFLTVFRFFTYLDTRIRREGWDVELKLRAEETYAGLARHDAGRGRPQTTAALLAVVFGLVSTGTALAAGDSAPTTGSARQSLIRQSFPWYDAASDRYRPLIEPRRSATKKSNTPRGTVDRQNSAEDGRAVDGGGGSGSGATDTADERTSVAPSHQPQEPTSPSVAPEIIDGLARGLMIALFVAAAATLITIVVRHGLGDRQRVEEVKGDAPVTVADDHVSVPLPAGIRLDDGDLLARAAAVANEGDYSTAILLFHAWMLMELDNRGGIVMARGKTNGQYLGEVAVANPAIADLFGASCHLFEDAFFGRLAIARADFVAVWERRSLVTSTTHPMEVSP